MTEAERQDGNEAGGGGRLVLVAAVNGVDGPEAQALFAAYPHGRVDGVELRLWLIRLFLDVKLCELISESSPALGIANAPLGRVDREAAERVVDAIIGVGEAEGTGVDYARLRRWFFGELFRPESVEWYANSSPAHRKPGGLPAVIGRDRERVAVFWRG